MLIWCFGEKKWEKYASNWKSYSLIGGQNTRKYRNPLIELQLANLLLDYREFNYELVLSVEFLKKTYHYF